MNLCKKLKNQYFKSNYRIVLCLYYLYFCVVTYHDTCLKHTDQVNSSHLGYSVCMSDSFDRMIIRPALDGTVPLSSNVSRCLQRTQQCAA